MENDIALVDADRTLNRLKTLVREEVYERINRIPTEYLEMTPEELTKLMNDGRATMNVSRFRTAFWMDAERAHRSGTKINIGTVCAAAEVSRSFFTNKIMQDPVLLAYVATPTPANDVATREMYNTAMPELRHMLLRAAEEFAKKPDPKWLEAYWKCMKWLDERLHGAVTQKIEQKNLNVNVEKKAEVHEAAPSIAEIDRKLRELEAQDVSGVLLPVIEVNKSETVTVQECPTN